MGPQSSVPVGPQPVQAVRKLLRSLPKGLARDEELRTLHITVSELLSPPVASSSAPIPETITNFFQTKLYQAEMRCLNIAGFHRTPEKSRSCGAWISNLLVSWADIIAQSAGSKVKILRNHRLHIATDSYTKGVLSTLMIVSETDTLQRPRLSFIPRKYAMGKELTHFELYALLAVALKEYHGQQMVEEITIFSTYSHWIQRITATIPSSYIRSILEETQQLVGDVEIRRGPCVSFLEEAGQRQILQTVFEYCNMEDKIPKVIIQARPPAFNNSKKRKSMTDEVRIERKRQKGPNIAVELLNHDG